MMIYKKKSMCCGCGACMEICPKKAITMVQDAEGFRYPKINRFKCIECKKCVQVCPIKNQEIVKNDNLYLGVQAKEDKLRYVSSSGGIFSILVRYVIEKQGIVYGAGYDMHMKVIHKEIYDFSQIDLIRGTKYVQSDVQRVYHSIKKNLEVDRWVLFCGTPCQVQALLLFLNKKYEKLIVVDLVCYGVTSPGIWRDYVKYLERLYNGKMSGFSFRDKRNTDNGHTCSYTISEKLYTCSIYDNLFCKMYFRNIILRPSCYECKFCTVDRKSDFTIGDFWGIEQINPEFDDGMGTSMVIAHTDKAKKIWEQIKQETHFFICMKENVLQPRLLSPTKAANGRRGFMILYKILPFSFIAKLVDN